MQTQVRSESSDVHARTLRSWWTVCFVVWWSLGVSYGLEGGASTDNATITAMGGNGSNGTSSDSDPVLSAEAIANISATGVGLCIISSTLCYLFVFFNKQERMERVRMAMERNRQIERQMAEARARQAREKQEGGGQGGQDELCFSQVHHSHEALHPPAVTMVTRTDEGLLAGGGTMPDPQPQTTEDSGAGEGSGDGRPIEVNVTVVQPVLQSDSQSTT